MTARTFILAAVFVATSILLVQASKAEPTPIRQPLAELPLVIGPWKGRLQPEFDPKIVKVLGVDDYTTRSYVGAEGRPVGLYVGYHSSQREGDTIHSPLNCLPGAGWIPVQQGRTVLSVAPNPSAGDSRQIEVNRVVIEKGLDRQLVLYWYQSHSRVVASEYWGKVYTVVDAIRLNRTDAALLRVLTPISSRDPGAVQAAEDAAASFVRALFPLLGHHLPS